MSLDTKISRHLNGNGSIPEYSGKDFSSDQDVRWCPGCGYYTILKQVQNTMPDIGVRRVNIEFISGISFDSNFPYYKISYEMYFIYCKSLTLASRMNHSRAESRVELITMEYAYLTSVT